MAKILVADDNSNVQKTVALALADLGVEVVAVNNGEAAVRKLPDTRPDLVLADIFMPVRNGYEVCEYVKKDARFSRVPVVLLVGAFDPLDEREAQRVGADGILKKPFVPPDPLIAMVKTLLDRALGDRLVGVGAAKETVAAQNKGGSVATVDEPPAKVEAAPEEELPAQEFQPPVDRLSFGDGEAPIAFEQLLNANPAQSGAGATGTVEPVDDEQVLTNSRDTSLGEPIFWRTESPESEAGEEKSETEEEEDGAAELPMQAWKLDSVPPPDSVPANDAPPAGEAEDFLQPVEPPFELVREETEHESQNGPTIAAPVSLVAQDAAAQAALTVESGKAPDLAANPIEWMASVPPPAPPPEEEAEAVAAADWSAPASEESEAVAPVEFGTLESAPAVPTPSVLASGTALLPGLPPATPAAPSPASQAVKGGDEAPDPHKTQPSLTPASTSPGPDNTASSLPRDEWSDLAASFTTPSLQQSTHEKQLDEKAAQGAAPAAPVSIPVSPASTASTEETAHSIPKQDWADLAASLESKAAQMLAEKPNSPSVPASPAPIAPAFLAAVSATPVAPAASTTASPSNLAPASAPDPALVEAVVQRVLEKMRPQVVDIITKEFLRPVVQALVHREIQKK